MAKTKFQIFKDWKSKYCKGQKGSYAKMRSACKRFVEAEVKKAPRGQKGKAREAAMKRARPILKSSCARS